MNRPDSENQHEEGGFLAPGLGGGPKGLGDPNDRTVRKIENELIVKKMREESKKLCVEEDEVFANCLRKGGFFFFVRCYSASQELKRCQLKWFHNEDFQKKIRDQYIDERSEYRRTGVTFAEREWLEKEYKKWSKEHEDGHKNSNTS